MSMSKRDHKMCQSIEIKQKTRSKNCVGSTPPIATLDS